MLNNTRLTCCGPLTPCAQPLWQIRMHRQLLYTRGIFVLESFEHVLKWEDVSVVRPRLVEGLITCVQGDLRVDASECRTHCSNLYLFSTAVAALSHTPCEPCCHPCLELEVCFRQIRVNSEGSAIGTPVPPKLFPIRRSRLHSPIGDTVIPSSEITFVLRA